MSVFDKLLDSIKLNDDDYDEDNYSSSNANHGGNHALLCCCAMEFMVSCGNLFEKHGIISASTVFKRYID